MCHIHPETYEKEICVLKTFVALHDCLDEECPLDDSTGQCEKENCSQKTAENPRKCAEKAWLKHYRKAVQCPGNAEMSANFLMDFKCYLSEYVEIFKLWLECFDEKLGDEENETFTALLSMLR